jgi:hypothetical protein
LESVVAVTMYKTGDHSARLRAVAGAAREFAGASPSVTKRRDTADFTELQVEVEVPIFQSGLKPYLEDGAMNFGADGRPALVTRETVRVVVSVPRRPMPAGGFPLVFHAVGSGGDGRGGRPAHGHDWCGAAARSAHPVGHRPWSATADQAGAASVAEGWRWGQRSRWYDWAWLPLAVPRCSKRSFLP